MPCPEIPPTGLAKQLADAGPVTDRSAHRCHRPANCRRSAWMFRCCRRSISGVRPLPVTTAHPALAVPPGPGHLNGDLGAHRDLPVDPDEDTEPARLAPVPVVGRGVYSREDSQRAWTRRRADLKKNTVIDDVLAEIDFRAKELERRTADVSAQGRGSGAEKRLGFRPIFMLD